MGDWDEKFLRRTDFVDPDGVLWRRRGTDALTGKALGRQLAAPGTSVLHWYAGHLTPVPAEEREAFWAEAQERMAESVHSEFVGVEFRHDDGRRMLVVDEFC